MAGWLAGLLHHRPPEPADPTASADAVAADEASDQHDARVDTLAIHIDAVRREVALLGEIDEVRKAQRWAQSAEEQQAHQMLVEELAQALLKIRLDVLREESRRYEELAALRKAKNAGRMQ